jgi:hypothetical protein
MEMPCDAPTFGTAQKIGALPAAVSAAPCRSAACLRLGQKAARHVAASLIAALPIIPIAISKMPINLREIKNHYMKYREDLCR